MTSRQELPCIKHGRKVLGYQQIELIGWLDKHKQPAVG
jgi:hypothetical protein